MAFGKKKAALEKEVKDLRAALSTATAKQVPMQAPAVKWYASDQTLMVKYNAPVVKESGAAVAQPMMAPVASSSSVPQMVAPQMVASPQMVSAAPQMVPQMISTPQQAMMASPQMMHGYRSPAPQMAAPQIASPQMAYVMVPQAEAAQIYPQYYAPPAAAASWQAAPARHALVCRHTCNRAAGRTCVCGHPCTCP